MDFKVTANRAAWEWKVRPKPKSKSRQVTIKKKLPMNGQNPLINAKQGFVQSHRYFMRIKYSHGASSTHS
jgi:hypothetical protein